MAPWQQGKTVALWHGGSQHMLALALLPLLVAPWIVLVGGWLAIVET